MGIDWGDYDNDGRLDLFVTTYSNENKCLYRNVGGLRFADESVKAGVDGALRPNVSFGCKFGDFDNDGRLDLLVASGHVWDNPELAIPGMAIRQPLKLLRNVSSNGTLTFADVSGTALHRISDILGRGLAIGDIDNDGRIDALVVDADGAPLVLRNRTPAAGNWLGVRLAGRATGATVTIRVGGRALVRHCRSDGSYMSASDARVHFGLGGSNRVDSLTVRWPSGRISKRDNVAGGRYITIDELD